MNFNKVIPEEEKKNYSLNLLMAEFEGVDKAEKQALIGKVYHSSYKYVSTIIFS